MSTGEQTKRRTSRTVWIAVIAAAALIVAGIVVFLVLQQPNDPDAGPSPTAPTSTPADAVVPVPSIEDLNGDDEKLASTVLEGCSAMSGDEGWVATGKVTNTSDEEQAFLVSVYFVHDDAPVNFAQSRVVVPAGETVPWVAVQPGASQESELSCEVVAVS